MGNSINKLGEDDISLMAELNIQGKRMLEDAILKRNVCVRKVIIEKHLPKYQEDTVEEPEYDKDFLLNIGMIFLVNKIINTSSHTKIEKKNEKVSLWDIAEFTIENWFAGIKSKWKIKKKH